MGYDVQSKKVLDPFDGQKDLKNKILRAVDSHKFQEDPLRVFRAVQFSARFGLNLDEKLFTLAKTMVEDGLMEELAKERIFEEIKKLLLKSQNISLGIKLLDSLRLFEDYHITTKSKKALDRASLLEFRNDKQKLVIMLALWSHTFTPNLSRKFVNTLSNDKILLNLVIALLKNQNKISLNSFTDYDLYLLAREVEIENFVLFLKALNKSNLALSKIANIKKRAIELNILTREAPSLLGGKDLLALGLKPSKNFSLILEKAYIAQIKGVFSTKEEAFLYLEELLS